METDDYQTGSRLRTTHGVIDVHGEQGQLEAELMYSILAQDPFSPPQRVAANVMYRVYGDDEPAYMGKLLNRVEQFQSLTTVPYWFHDLLRSNPRMSAAKLVEIVTRYVIESGSIDFELDQIESRIDLWRRYCIHVMTLYGGPPACERTPDGDNVSLSLPQAKVMLFQLYSEYNAAHQQPSSTEDRP